MGGVRIQGSALGRSRAAQIVPTSLESVSRLRTAVYAVVEGSEVSASARRDWSERSDDGLGEQVLRGTDWRV